VLVFVFCALMACRVMILSAAFPIFNNVDECLHYDYVWNCAAGKLPTPMQKISPEVSRLTLMYSWVAYYQNTEAQIKSNRMLPPVWTIPKPLQAPALTRAMTYYTSITNHETVQPPIYYILTGLWSRLGSSLELPEQLIPFWVRFLNVPLVALMVWVSYRIVRLLFPDNHFLRLGVPMMIAALPQDVFYSINNSAMAPVVYTIALYPLALIHTRQDSGYGLYAVAGLAVGATLLTSYTTVPILVLVAALAAAKLVNARKTGCVRSVAAGLAVLLLALAALPVAWAVRNHMLFGDWTALPAYLRHAGWKPLPFTRMCHHPIFTPRGAAHFWSELITTYFRGEFVWHAKRLTSPALDHFYAWSSLVCPLAALIAFLRKGAKSRAAGLASAGVFAASVAMMVFASIKYDFGNWFCPSRSDPYYSAGRLILGTIVPFAVLYLTGFELILRRLRLDRIKFVLLAVLCLLMVGTDVLLSLPAFGTDCNFFHLP
jgi:hypothetical protein